MITVLKCLRHPTDEAKVIIHIFNKLSQKEEVIEVTNRELRESLEAEGKIQ